jgi:hypothetical protein
MARSYRHSPNLTPDRPSIRRAVRFAKRRSAQMLRRAARQALRVWGADADLRLPRPLSRPRAHRLRHGSPSWLAQRPAHQLYGK